LANRAEVACHASFQADAALLARQAADWFGGDRGQRLAFGIGPMHKIRTDRLLLVYLVTPGAAPDGKQSFQGPRGAAILTAAMLN
jgi:hypothetical protein